MLGPRIAALRKRSGMSQAELARRLRISPSAVGMYEQGRREPPAETLVQLAEIFEVSTDFLLTGIPNSRQNREALRDLLDLGLEEGPSRRKSGFTRQELAALLCALLTDT